MKPLPVPALSGPWQRLYKALREGDTVVFDSVSRMSRDAEEGSHTYTDLFARGVELVFLKEHYIDTVTYKNALQGKIELTGTDIDLILDGINYQNMRAVPRSSSYLLPLKLPIFGTKSTCSFLLNFL